MATQAVSVLRPWLTSSPAPMKSYIICGTPRSGTTLLCEALLLTGVAGRPSEYFQAWSTRKDDRPAPGSEDLKSLLADGTTPNGVFGAKIMWTHFHRTLSDLRAITGDSGAPPHQALATIFPGLRYIKTLRRDNVRQAVSLSKAVQSNHWADLGPLADEPAKSQWIHELALMSPFFDRQLTNTLAGSRQSAELRYDFKQLAGFLRTIQEHDAAWTRYFAEAGITPHTVVYEDLADNYDETVLATLDYLEIDRPPPSARPRIMRRQSDALNDEWTARLVSDLADSGVA